MPGSCQSYVPYPSFTPPLPPPHSPPPAPLPPSSSSSPSPQENPLDLAIRHTKAPPPAASPAATETAGGEEERSGGGGRKETCEQGTQDEAAWRCLHCAILFLDEVMHALHMSCHGDSAAYQCSICLHVCADKYDFTSHIQRGLHRPAPPPIPAPDRSEEPTPEHQSSQPTSYALFCLKKKQNNCYTPLPLIQQVSTRLHPHNT